MAPISVRDSHKSLPVSLPMVLANNSLLASSCALKRCSSAIRSSSGVRFQLWKAFFAAFTAASTFSALASCPAQITSSEMGLRESKDWPEPATHWPLIRCTSAILRLLRFNAHYPNRVARANTETVRLLWGELKVRAITIDVCRGDGAEFRKTFVADHPLGTNSAVFFDVVDDASV